MNVLIAGDFCDRYRISDLIARGNYASLFDDIKYLTEQADVSIINFEFPIVLHAGVPITKSGPTTRAARRSRCRQVCRFQCLHTRQQPHPRPRYKMLY